MKANTFQILSIIFFNCLFAVSVANAQNCIDNTSYTLNIIQDNGDGTCNYSIDLCAEVNGSPSPKHIVYEVQYDTSGYGVYDNRVSYTFDPSGKTIADGTYCLSGMSTDQTFIITASCGLDLNIIITGYTNGSQGNGGNCVAMDSYVNTSSLPVELTQFNAKAADQNVILSWATASEINNDYFVVENSIDANNFIEIGRVEGQGNSNTMNTYHYTDETPNEGENFYRLRQVDLDGTDNYSNIKTVNITSREAYSLFPTTATDQINIQLASGSKNKLPIRIVNTNGQILLQTNMQQGQDLLTIPVEHLTPGYYFVILEDRKFTSRKFMKV